MAINQSSESIISGRRRILKAGASGLAAILLGACQVPLADPTNQSLAVAPINPNSAASATASQAVKVVNTAQAANSVAPTAVTTAAPANTASPTAVNTPHVANTATTNAPEQLNTRAEIQTNIDAFKNMSEAKYRHQVERLYWANDGADRGNLNTVSFWDEDNSNNSSVKGPANRHRLGLMSRAHVLAGKNSQHTQYEFSAIILGVQLVHDMTPDDNGQPLGKQAAVVWSGTSVGDKREVIPMFLAEDNPGIPGEGYYLQNTNAYATKTVNGEVIAQRYKPTGTTDMVAKVPKVLAMIKDRVGDSGIFRIVSFTFPTDPTETFPLLARYMAGIAYQSRGLSAQVGQQFIDTFLGNPVDDVISTLPQSPLAAEITDNSVLKLIPAGLDTFYVATPILSAFGQ